MVEDHQGSRHQGRLTAGENHCTRFEFNRVIEDGGYFEGDVSKGNLFRDELVSKPYEVGKDGCVRPLEGNGPGLKVDEEFLQKHPLIEGPGYV